jgi:hypothetical protein
MTPAIFTQIKKELFTMKFSMKFLPVIGLAMALAPFAAQAQNATQAANGCYRLSCTTVRLTRCILTPSAAILLITATSDLSGPQSRKLP